MSYTKIASATYNSELIEIFQLDSTGDVPALKELIVHDMVSLDGKNSRDMINNMYLSELQLTIVDQGNFFSTHLKNRKSADFYCQVSKSGNILFFGLFAPKITPHKWFKTNNLVTLLFSNNVKQLESSRVISQNEIGIGAMLLDIINDLPISYDLKSISDLLHDNISVPDLIWDSYKVDRSFLLDGIASPNKKDLLDRFLQTFNLECRFVGDEVYIIKKDALVQDPVTVENYTAATSGSVSIRKANINIFDPETTEIEDLPPVLELLTRVAYRQYDYEILNPLFANLSGGEFTDWEVEGNVRQNLALSRNAIFEDINARMEQQILRHIKNPDSVSFHIEADFTPASSQPDGVYTFSYAKIVATSEDNDLLYLTTNGWSATEQSLESTVTFVGGSSDDPSVNIDIEDAALPFGPTKFYSITVTLELGGDTNALASTDPAEYKEISSKPVNVSDQTESALYQSLNTGKDVGISLDEIDAFVDDKNFRNAVNGLKYLDDTEGSYLPTESFGGITLHHRLQADHLSLVTDQPAYIIFNTHYEDRPTLVDVIEIVIDEVTLLFLPTRIESGARSKVCTVIAHQLKKTTAIDQSRFFD